MAVSITVVIKALNEQDKIASCIESVFSALGGYDFEVVLADSLSSDRTIEIAAEYPITIVQLLDASDQSCGAGAQLGYQYATGVYILLVDGDMELSQRFLPEAMKLLEDDHQLAGVGGRVIDKTVLTHEEKYRAQVYSKIVDPLDVQSLGGGGVYRRSCIESVGYFAHSGLAACEELELGVRLKAQGFRLKRIPTVFCYHKGHRESSLESLKRKFRSGRLAAYGYFLRSSCGKPWFWLACKNVWYLGVFPAVLGAGVIVWMVVGSFWWAFIGFMSFWTLLGVAQMARKRSIRSAFWSLASWWLLFFASVKPLLSKAKCPKNSLASKIIKLGSSG